MNPTNPKVDAYLQRIDRWRAEWAALRAILLECPLTEDLKWGVPCYTLDGKNVVLIHGFKDYCALLFHKGALMQDPEGILIQQTDNVQSARQIRFTSLDEIQRMQNLLKTYIHDAIEVERAGLNVVRKTVAEFAMPEEFVAALDGDPGLKSAFEALTPGRQRAYLLHFSSAKQSATRQSRIEKCRPKIMAGKGLDD
ncbi:uncharacterized protein YdeI (YjbR/CyaY-like superfamily) [Rhizobium aquaticum]|uniref:Uncharacterized protein YdeI (YjbR/CyaY-like superfamily) n=1 Tax=Rhizobium aquaticum TaxID=1549636 RepID=A0ABV2IZ48_9HYPH